METAFSRHATSKLRTAAELRNITTLGFRGEALPSIAAVSLLTCVTCTADAEAATRYRIEYGEPDDQPRPTGTAVSTSIAVENMFGNQPARLKFLRTKPTKPPKCSASLRATLWPTPTRAASSSTIAANQRRRPPRHTSPWHIGGNGNVEPASIEDAPEKGVKQQRSESTHPTTPTTNRRLSQKQKRHRLTKVKPDASGKCPAWLKDRFGSKPPKPFSLYSDP